MKYIAVIALVLCVSIFSFAQTGPGGIGNTNGTSDLRLWYDANQISYSNNALINSVTDLSGYGNTLTASGTERPTYSTNGGPNSTSTMVFTGSNELETSYTGNSNENMSFGVVLNFDNTAETDIIIQHGGRNIFAINASEKFRDFIGGSAHLGASSYSASTWMIHSKTIANSGTNRLKFYVNNDNTDNFTHNIESRTSHTWIGGNGTGGGTKFNGSISEVYKFTRVLNTAERIIIDNYMAAKYNISLTTNDIYTQDDNANGDYDYDVAGIGRVDASNLHDDAQGTGIVRILNPSGLGNNEFLMWGHDTGTQTLNSTTDIPNSVKARFAREWRVSEVNASGTAVDVGNIDIRWDLTSQSNIVTADLRLLIDTDNDGNFADETPISGASSLGNNIYAFTGVSAIVNGRRFTLASTNKANVSTDPTHFEYISNVQIGSINNTTTGSDADGDGNTGYDDFTTQTTVLLPSLTYSLSVTLHADKNDYVKAWIDWNDDGDFLDASEEYTIVSNTNSNGAHSVNISVPASATGNSVKLRVALKYKSAPTSTETVDYGEVEEYTIYIDKDTDGDGVYNSNDKDADNDGILDNDENFCISQDFRNGNFESGPYPSTFVITDKSNVDGWNTTASDNKIEIWKSGYRSIPAYEGGYFAEINANHVLPQRLFQVLNVDPGDIVKWNVAHRGRNGIDTMAIKVGPTGSPTIQQMAATDKTSWQVYSSSYTVPAGVTQIEIGFEAIYTASGNSSIGNFIDDVQLYITKTTYCDSDGDGTPNIYDLDSDNDGIADVIEAGGTDPDNDGRIGTGAITDTDGDGLSNIVDTDNGGTALAEPNSDSDALKNYMDIDSDNDGIVDNIEGQTTASYIAPSGIDANNNGWDDAYDGNAGGSAITPTNTDGDNSPDYIDTNSDNDDASDAMEAYDTDKDGVINKKSTNIDSDGDGLDNAYDSDGSSSTDNGGATNNHQTANNFPNNDNSTSSERDWREGPSTLPVSLISFNAVLKSDFVEITWITASEINNDYFIVQRSMDNKIFEDIDKVNGNGNSNIIIEYKSLDMELTKGITYYRLKQVDYDGTTDFSNVVAIRNINEENVLIFPNPSYNNVNIEVKEAVDITLYSVNGQQIANYHLEENSKLKIDFSDKLKGVYFLSFVSNNKSIIKKIVIM